MNRPNKILLFILLLFINYLAISQDVSIYFDYDKYEIKDKYKTDLVDVAKKHKNDKITITGYTDSKGDVDYNQKLSLKRANSVKQFLIKNGYNKSNIIAISGEGEIRKGVKQFNRRVDIVIEYEMVPPPEILMEVDESKPKLNNYNEIRDLKVGETLALEGINFTPGRHFLIESSEPQLYQLLFVLKNNPTLKVEIQGHICCMPSGDDGLDADTQTMDLSVNRAKYIYQYLINNGIDADRLSYKGFGASKPLVVEITEADQIKNRRVEIMIVAN
jgi:outer membrane protein OmpA-like peptidoglycan-associated protein